jgi:hypothetical protein
MHMGQTSPKSIRCKARVKTGKQCKKMSVPGYDFCQIHGFGKIKGAPWYENGIFLTIASLVVGFFIAYGFFIKGPSQESQNKILAKQDETSKEVSVTTNLLLRGDEKILNDLQEIKKIVGANVQAYGTNWDSYDKVYPGWSVHCLIKIFTPFPGRDNFIFDRGREHNNRFSIYMNSDQDLCFRVIDKDSNTLMVKVSPSLETFLFDNEIYLFCEYGSVTNFSFIRVVINGKQVAEKHQNASLVMSEPIENAPAIVGFDIEHQNIGNFELGAIAEFSATMDNAAGIEKVFDYWNSSKHDTNFPSFYILGPKANSNTQPIIVPDRVITNVIHL